MFALVESIMPRMVVDRPDLGCAMIIAACKENGIKPILIKGQTRYLKHLFIDDAAEMWHLIKELKHYRSERFRLYPRDAHKRGIRDFQEELKTLYQNVIVDKNPRAALNANDVEKLVRIYKDLRAIFLYFIEELGHVRLSIVQRYVDEIVKTNPKYIGFSICNKIDPLTRCIIRRVKELTGKPIIVGGQFTPFIEPHKMREEFLKGGFDYLVIGAGEEAVPLLIEAIDKNKGFNGIPNVFYKKNSRIEVNELKVINDLDRLPYPDYSQFDLDLYLAPKRVLPLQATRGCTWRKCAFCSHHNIYLGTCRSASTEKIVDTIRHLHRKYNCRHFEFHDEELPAEKARCISEAILDSNLKELSFITSARFDRGYNDNRLLRLMRKAGFSSFIWGMESGSQKILDSMNKGIRVEIISQILKKSSKNNIANLCYVIFGFPGETKRELDESIDFFKKHADYIEELAPTSFSLKGTFSPIGKDPQKWGIKLKKGIAYSKNNKIGFKEATVFCHKFIRECIGMNSIRVTSGKIRYIPTGFNRRLLHFLFSSYHLISEKALLKYLDIRKLNSIYPLLPGEIKKIDKKIVLFPINIKESVFVNRISPLEPRSLTRIEEQVFNLSDGTLSIKEILSKIYDSYDHTYPKKDIYKTGLDFYKQVFSGGEGVGFSKSWR